MQRKLSMDDFGVLSRLLFNQNTAGNVEGVARCLGLVHLYRASGVHLLAFFTFLDRGLSWILRTLGIRVRVYQILNLLIVAVTIFWIWKLQDFRLTFVRPILTFLIRKFFTVRGAKARVLVPLGLTFISEFILSRESSLSDGALDYYLSVSGGLLAFHLSKTKNSVLKHLALAVGSWLPIAMISLIHDHFVSYLTPFLSLVTLPIISLVFYPLTLMDYFLHSQVSPFTVSLWNGFLKFLFCIPEYGLTFSSVTDNSIKFALPIAFLFALFWSKISFVTRFSFWRA